MCSSEAHKILEIILKTIFSLDIDVKTPSEMVQIMGRVDSELFSAWVSFLDEFSKLEYDWLIQENHVENPL